MAWITLHFKTLVTMKKMASTYAADTDRHLPSVLAGAGDSDCA